MANDDLTGNLPTEVLLDWFDERSIFTPIDKKAFQESYDFSSRIFS
jgi:hypothetical protein